MYYRSSDFLIKNIRIKKNSKNLFVKKILGSTNICKVYSGELTMELKKSLNKWSNKEKTSRRKKKKLIK